MKVCVNNVYSEPKPLEFSVPQGSVLRLQLFSIYASTLGKAIEGRQAVINGFADDHTLHCNDVAGNKEQEQEAKNDLEGCLKDIS